MNEYCAVDVKHGFGKPWDALRMLQSPPPMTNGSFRLSSSRREIRVSFAEKALYFDVGSGVSVFSKKELVELSRFFADAAEQLKPLE